MIEAFRERLSQCPDRVDFKAAMEVYHPAENPLAAE
jgi:hypothetical protein